MGVTKKTTREEAVRLLDQANKELIQRVWFDDAKKCILSAQKNRTKAEVISYHEGVVDSFVAEAKGYTRTFNVKQAMALFNEALELAEKNKYLRGIGHAKVGIARLYLGSREPWDKILEYTSDGIEIGVRINDRYLEWNSHRTLSGMFGFLRDFPRAFGHYKKALELVESFGNATDICLTLIEWEPYRDPPALYEDYARQAVEIAHETNLDNYLRGKVLEKYALALMQLGKQKESIQYRDELVELLPFTPNYEIAYRHLVLGDLYLENKENTKAIQNYESVLKIGIEPAFERLAYMRLGRIYSSHEYQKAIECFERARALPEDPTEKNVEDLYGPLANIYRSIGENDKAMELYELCIKKMTEATLHEDVQKNEYAQLIRSFDESQNKQQKLAEELEVKTSALTEKAMLLAEQTELIANFRDEMRAILRKVEANDPAINEIRRKLRDLPEAVNWKDFDEQFQSVHPRFQDVLRENYPALTKMELKNCVLLRLNLNSRDISKLLCLSKRTIESHRHSIRKKLGLKPEDDVAKFLQRI